jgi:dTDP-4-amino-4,6-dideoxygalactose transaminase
VTIGKLAAVRAFERPCFQFANARSAFAAFLKATKTTQNDLVLLPSFIGWSAREGSGVFDPVAEAGCRYAFYPISHRLAVNVDATKELISKLRPKVFVLVHYFGFPDPHAVELAKYALSTGALVLEDEAHAMLSDVIGAICGRAGTAAIFSLHKLLPVPEGGVLVLNDDGLDNIPTWNRGTGAMSDYDLVSVAGARRQNAETLLDRIKALRTWMTPLYGEIPAGVIPQTLPVLIEGKNRDELYFKFNDAGFGVVSLYHTLISAVEKTAFPESHCLSKMIMNLPVHQDVGPTDIEAFVHFAEREC